MAQRGDGAVFAVYVDRLDIRNFRCFAERTLAFDRRFTLLIGANGTGKTAVLDALAVALGAALIPLPVRSKGIAQRDVRRAYRFVGESGHFVEYYPTRIEASGSFGDRELAAFAPPQIFRKRVVS